MTKAEQILTQVFDAIEAGNVGTTNDRSRTDAIGISELPFINLKPGNDTSQKLGSGLKSHQFEIELDFHVAGSPPDQIADAFIDKAHSAIMAWQPLRAMIADIDYVSREWEADDGDEQRGKVIVKYLITYSNLAGQL
jgi:hypothetical protein